MDDYESGLIEHPNKGEHGKLSQYFKRLTERDREGVETAHHSFPLSSQMNGSEENVVITIY